MKILSILIINILIGQLQQNPIRMRKTLHVADYRLQPGRVVDNYSTEIPVWSKHVKDRTFTLPLVAMGQALLLPALEVGSVLLLRRQQPLGHRIRFVVVVPI